MSDQRSSIRARRHATPMLLLLIAALLPAGPGLAGSSGSARGAEDWGTCHAGKSAAAPDAAWDETTGRDLRHFPPDRIVDYQHMRLQLVFEDLDDRRFTAVETLRIMPISAGATSLQLDAVGLDISSVKLDGRPIEFYHDDQVVTVRFDEPLAPGQGHEIEFHYTCDRPYAGLIFTPSKPSAPDYAPQVHTQGQPEDNRHWFIAHDSPNERMTTELIVDVPVEYSVCSNGRLLSHEPSGNRATWHWLQDRPHVSYLVSLLIGQFDVVEIPHRRVQMHVWVPPGLGGQVLQTYGRTGQMIDLFERRLGVAYPWARYDQILAKNFGAGGMENTSVTTMYPTAVLDGTALLDEDLDGLIAHELAHQWTGDLLTCKSWAHIWLNEGWATFGAALWFEERDGHDGYLDSMRRSFGVARRDKTTNTLPMVSPVYGHPWETFRRPANPYPKGASILHMLRMMLGEEQFWAGVHLYMNRHADGLVETSDFRYAMEEVSGRGLEWFFDQWCYRPGTPELEVQARYDLSAGEMLIDIEQAQHIDARTPAFRFTLPVCAVTDSGTEVFPIEVRQRHTSFRAPITGVPRIIAVDPELHVLKTIKTDKPLGMWLAQARGGPTIAARHTALEALRAHDTPETIALATSIILDESLRHTLRRTAIGTLAAYGSSEARDVLLDLARRGVEDARVQAELIVHLRDLDRADVLDLLADTAQNAPSYGVREAAIRSLAHHKAREHADLLAELVHVLSQHEKIRTAALEALAALDDPRGLTLGMQYATYGHMDRARPPAITAIGTLAHHDPDQAIAFLIPLLDDPERRAVSATIDALAQTADERAVGPLEALATSCPNPRFRRQAEEAAARLKERLVPAASVAP